VFAPQHDAVTLNKASAPNPAGTEDAAAPVWSAGASDSDSTATPLGSSGPAWYAASLGVAAAAAADSASTPAYTVGPGAPSGGSGDSDGWGGSGGSGGSGGWGGSGGASGSGGSRGSSGSPGRQRKGSARKVVGIAAAVAVLAAAGGAYVYLQKSSSANAAGNKGHDKSHPGSTVAKGPEHVVSITPQDGTTGVNGAAAISVVFSEPLSASSPLPTLTPSIPGTWQRSGDTAVFTPAKSFRPRSKVTVQVPGGSTGVQSNGGGLLAAAVTAQFKTGTYSTVRIEQLLAQLGYLPLTWAPSAGAAPSLTDANAQFSAAFSPPQGTYTWESGYPSALMSMWKPDQPNELLRGAVMAFQADHNLMSDMIVENQDGLTLSGPIGHRLWQALFRAAARDEMNKHGYTYALASQHVPETLTVWHNGAEIFHHLANTGIPVSPTAVRTDPVYIRLQSQIMKGTNPNGTKYADQVYWVAYFHAGEAVHFFQRYSYGSQQSLGCVELPYNAAKRIWPYLTYGSLVTVTKP
jgi:Bacterial Ig-like domain